MFLMEIQHFSHEHPLVLRALSVDKIHKTRCKACEEPILDLMYSREKCENYCIHKICSKLPQKITRHPFHPSHPLPIQLRGHYACCGCGQWHDKVHYWCVACNFTISPECALNPTKKYDFLGQEQIRYFLHRHPLTLADGKPMGDGGVKEVCLACEKSVSSPSYLCQECPSFKLHKSCVEQLPRAIHSHPEHPMILRAKDKWFDQLCAACGRSDNVLTYRCSMCQIEMECFKPHQASDLNTRVSHLVIPRDFPPRVFLCLYGALLHLMFLFFLPVHVNKVIACLVITK